MANFQSVVVSSRGTAVKGSNPQSVTVNAWDDGVKVVPRKRGASVVFEVYATGGSNATKNERPLGELVNGVWEPAE